MLKQFPVRYGRNYKVVLAIVLPCLLIVPFIMLLHGYKPLEEWKVWLIVFAFLGLVISLSVWLTLRVYPKTVLSINSNEISLSFDQNNFLSPTDFNFDIADIISFTQHEIKGGEYFLFETQNPIRKFQVSSSSNSVEDLLSFNEAMTEISEIVSSKVIL